MKKFLLAIFVSLFAAQSFAATIDDTISGPGQGAKKHVHVVIDTDPSFTPTPPAGATATPTATMTATRTPTFTFTFTPFAQYSAPASQTTVQNAVTLTVPGNKICVDWVEFWHVGSSTVPLEMYWGTGANITTTPANAYGKLIAGGNQQANFFPPKRACGPVSQVFSIREQTPTPSSGAGVTQAMLFVHGQEVCPTCN